jgi:hypothetical protein
MKQWVTHLSIVVVAFALGFFLYNVIARRVEGFANNIQKFKDSADYKKVRETLVARIDPIASKRRGIDDMLSNGTKDMPEHEQCLVNFHVLATRFTGFIGPNGQNYFDPEIAIPYALKAGCRSFIYEIDYLEDCVGNGEQFDYYPKLVIRDIHGRLIVNPATSEPQCVSDRTSTIFKVSRILRDNAFSSTIQNSTDPLIVVLFIHRLPPTERTGNKRLLTFFSRIAKGLQPLADKTIDSILQGGIYSRQKQESALLINNIRTYEGRVLVFCNADTSAFRDAKYPQNEDLDFLVNLRLTYKQTQLGCTSNPTGASFGGIETVESFKVVPPDQVTNTCNDLKLRWTVALSQDSLKAVDKNAFDKLTNTYGVHCVPIQFYNEEYDYVYDKKLFEKWSFIPKPKSLRFVKPPVAVPAKQVKEADAKGGQLRAPTL